MLLLQWLPDGDGHAAAARLPAREEVQRGGVGLHRGAAHPRHRGLEAGGVMPPPRPPRPAHHGGQEEEAAVPGRGARRGVPHRHVVMHLRLKLQIGSGKESWKRTFAKLKFYDTVLGPSPS